MNKKGGMTAKQIITIVILIVSFAILVIFFFALNIRSMMTENVCTNSLVWRSLPLASELELASVACESQDVCINIGGSCSGVREDAINILVSGNEEVNEEILKLNDSCDKITGSGEINYGSEGECGICYIIYFDENLQEQKFDVIQKLDKTKPIAVVAFSTEVKRDYTKILLSQYTAEKLKETECESYLF
jgi:hypothetical protein